MSRAEVLSGSILPLLPDEQIESLRYVEEHTYFEIGDGKTCVYDWR